MILQDLGRSVTAFLVGFIGWLAVAAIRPVDPWLWVAPFALGLAAAYLTLFLSTVSTGFGVGLLAAAGLRSLRARSG